MSLITNCFFDIKALVKITPLHKFSEFFSKYRLLQYHKGEVILRAKDEPRGVYYLTNGFVKLYSIAKTGQEFTLIIFKPGDLFPIMWAINNTPNDYFLGAQTAVSLRRAPKADFLEFIKDNSDVFFELTSRMLARFGGLLTRMEYLVFGDAYNKVASILLICAARFGEKVGRSVVIRVPLTHGDIATLVGMTRETVSIEMKKMEKEEIIGYRRRLIVIKNARRLRKKSMLES